jgi:hypothetical protein
MVHNVIILVELLILAILWKYLVFLSPYICQLILDFSYQNISSMLRALFKSNWGIEQISLNSTKYQNDHHCQFYLEQLSIWSRTFPKMSLFHVFSFSFNIFSFWLRMNIGQPTTNVFQQFFITSLQLSCNDHIFKNSNWDLNLVLLFEKSSKRGKWSDLFLTRVEQETD